MNRLLAVILLAALTASLICAPARAQETTVKTGEIAGAPFEIRIPPDWNNCLVMYAHAYLPRGVTWSPLHDALAAVFLDRGFALAESGYTRQGWAVEEGIRDTEALRRHFIDEYDEPDTTFIAGHSLGSIVTIASIEAHPDAYNGALPLCALLAPSLVYFKDRVLDQLVTFEYLFAESIPPEHRPVMEAPDLPIDVVMCALQSDPATAAEFAGHWGMRETDLPRLLAFGHLLYRELTERAGGNPVDNTNTIYTGPGTAGEMNDAVCRCAADPAAVAYIGKYYTPTGALEDPVIAVHTTYDPGVPPYLTSFYATTTALAGNGHWFVQMWVEADGHCNIAPPLMGKAFDHLRQWAATGARPEPGAIR
jgi:pimeloyl-ACP methyl ester carboxylesterase